MSRQLNPTGFRVGSTTVGVTFAHSDSFRPDYASSSWSFKDLLTGKDLLYWDAKAYLAILELPAARTLLDQRSKSQTQVDPDEEFFASLEADLSKAEEAKKAPAQPATTAPIVIPSVKLTSIALPKASGSKDSGDSAKTGEKRKAKEPELIIAKKNSASIEHWNRKKADVDAVQEPVAEQVQEVNTRIAKTA